MTEISLQNVGTKLDTVDTNANNYSHPTGNGNNHVPSDGSSGQFLGYSSAGTAAWVASPSASTTYYAVGTYLFGFHLQNNGTISGGATKAGSTLMPAGLGWASGDGNERSVNGGVWHGVESAPSGTWRFMSSMTTNISGRYPGGLWLRIS